MDVTKLVEYIEKKKKEGKEYTYFHAFMTAIGATIYNRPKLNRFVTNRHVYEHNEIIISFVAKIISPSVILLTFLTVVFTIASQPLFKKDPSPYNKNLIFFFT